MRPTIETVETFAIAFGEDDPTILVYNHEGGPAHHRLTYYAMSVRVGSDPGSPEPEDAHYRMVDFEFRGRKLTKKGTPDERQSGSEPFYGAERLEATWHVGWEVQTADSPIARLVAAHNAYQKASEALYVARVLERHGDLAETTADAAAAKEAEAKEALVEVVRSVVREEVEAALAKR